MNRFSRTWEETRDRLLFMARWYEQNPEFDIDLGTSTGDIPSMPAPFSTVSERPLKPSLTEGHRRALQYLAESYERLGLRDPGLSIEIAASYSGTPLPELFETVAFRSARARIAHPDHDLAKDGELAFWKLSSLAGF
jgi:hypothetical protein